MAIEHEINRPISTVFRRAYIKRRRLVDGKFEDSWQNITEYVTEWGEINAAIDDVCLNTFVHSGIDLVVDNRTGAFNNESNANSMWAGHMPRYRSLLKIEAGYVDDTGSELPTDTTLGIFVLTDEISINAANNQAILRAKSLQSFFDEVQAKEVTGLGATATASEIMAKVRDHTDGSGNFVFREFITSTAWAIQTTTAVYNFATTTSILEKSCWEMMNQIAECEGYVLLINRSGGFEFRDRSERTSTAQFDFYGRGFREQNVISLDNHNEGINKYYNYFSLRWNGSETSTSYVYAGTVTAISPANNSWKYGNRKYEFENPFFLTASTAQTLVDNLLTTFNDLKEEVTVKAKFTPQLELLDKVTFSYRSYQLGDDTLWDYSEWDGGLWADDDIFDWYQISFKVLSKTHNLNDFTSDLVLRRI